MRAYTCKCKSSEWWGEVMPCAKCEQCGTGPGSREPKDHDWYASKVDTDEGEKTRTRCRWCMKKKVL